MPCRKATHIDVHIHSVCNLVKQNIIDIKYVSSKMIDADIVTEAVDALRLNNTKEWFHIEHTACR